MSFKLFENKSSILSQLKSIDLSIHKNVNSLLNKCGQTIEELQQQLQRQIKLNQEKQQTITFLTKQNEFYQQECRNSTYYDEVIKLKEQTNKHNVLINTMKKVNRELLLKVEQLTDNLGLKQSEVSVLKKQNYQILQSKRILEEQWNRTIKSVKNRIKQIDFSNKKQSDKENFNPRKSGNINQIPQEKQNLQQRAKKMLTKINKKLILTEIDDLNKKNGEFQENLEHKTPYKLSELSLQMLN